jgi:hypothetical protein
MRAPLPLWERLRIKRALLDQRIQVAGMSERELLAAYARLIGAPVISKCEPCKRGGYGQKD